MVSDLASAGTMMPGSTVLPLLVTIWPLGSSWKLPSRVYAVVPSGICTWKKPLPLTATSSELDVCVKLPCEWLREVATARAPRPTCMPVGSVVCSVLLAPGWRSVWYIRSSKTACDFL